MSFSNSSSIDKTISLLLKQLNITVSNNDILTELDKHPDEFSILAISDVLHNFGVENSAFRVDASAFEEVSTPFIAHLNVKGGSFVVVSKIKGGTVWLADNNWNNKISKQDFLSLFTGVALTVTPADKHKSFKHRLVSYLYYLPLPFILASIVFLLVSWLTFNSGYFNGISWPILLFIVFKTLGVAISVLLLLQSIDQNNPLIKKLCKGGAGSKTDCDAILSSKAATVFRGLSWSEVGFFYFSGSWLVLLFNIHSMPLIGALVVLNAISLPYTIYSIYYQAIIAKKWCLFCCAVQVLLWLECLSVTAFYKYAFSWPHYTVLCTLFVYFVVPIILWLLLKPLLLKLQQINSLKQQLKIFKYNNEAFTAMIQQQPKYSLPDEKWSIVIGNSQAVNSITIVSNPYCQPCAQTHQILNKLLQLNQNLQARIIFSPDNTAIGKRELVSNHLMALSDSVNKATIEQALTDWYKQRDYQKWAEIYPTELNDASYAKLEKQKKWCQLAEITATPTILFNGYRLPNVYSISDIKYILD